MKKRLFFLPALGILLFLLLLLTPALLSTQWGKERLIAFLQQPGMREISLEELSLSWLGPQQIKKIKITLPKEQFSLSVDALSTSTPLWNLLLPKKDLKKVTIDSPHFSIAQHSSADRPKPAKEQPVAFAASLEKRAPQFDPCLIDVHEVFHPTFKGTFTIRNGALIVTTLTQEKLSLTDLESSLIFSSYAAPDHLDLSAKVSEGNDSGSFSLQAKLSASHALQVEAVMQRFPLALVDSLFSGYAPAYSGLLQEALGPSLDLSLRSLISKEQFSFSLQSSSQNFSAYIESQKEADAIAFLPSSRLSLSLSPQLIQRLATLSPLFDHQLKQAAQLEIALQKLQFPLRTDHSIHYCQSALQATLSLSSLSLLQKNSSSFVSFPALTLSLSTDNFQESLSAHLHSQMITQGTTAAVDVAAAIKEYSSADITATASNFPLIVLDPSGTLSQFLGDHGDLTLHTTWEKGQSLSQISFGSANLKIPQATIATKEDLEVQFSAPVTFSLTAQSLQAAHLQQLFSAPPREPLEITIEKLRIPRLFALQDLELKAKTALPPLFLSLQPQRPPLSLPDLSVDLSLNGLKSLSLSVESNHLSAAIKAALHDFGQKIELLAPVHLEATLTDADWQSLLPQAIQSLHLTEPATLTADLQPFTWSAPFTALPLEAKAKIDRLSLQKSAKSHTMLLKEILFSLQSSPKDNRLALAGKGKAFENQESAGSFDFAFQLPLQPPYSSIQGTLQANKLSTGVIDLWLDSGLSLTPLIGPTLDLSLAIKDSGQEKNLACQVNSSNLSAKAGFLVGKEGMQLQRGPAHISLHLTQEGFSSLDQLLGSETLPFRLASPTTVEISLSALQFSQSNSQAIVSGSFSLPEVTLSEKGTEQTITIKKIEGEIKKSSHDAPLQMSLFAATQGQGELSLKAESNLLRFTPFNPAAITASFSADFHNFPLLILDFFSQPFTRSSFSLTTGLGEKIQGSVSGKLAKNSGDFQLNLLSDQTKASMKGTITNGVLALDEPLHLQLTMTKELSQALLKQANPLGIKSFTSENPLTVEIAPAGFSFPLFPFDIAALNIPSVHAELGKIRCSNRGNLKTVLKLLKNNPFSREDELTLWFAPIHLQIERGVLQMQRSEILLADSLEIALWGTINFPKERVDMVLGLTDQALKKSFGISNLPDRYVLQIPLKGPTSDVSIDKAAATAKIAAILAWDQTSKSTAPGGLFGQFLGAIAALPDKDANTPPPNKPFPWDSQQAKSSKNRKSAATEKESLPQKKGPNPLKELIKAIK